MMFYYSAKVALRGMAKTAFANPAHIATDRQK
jgi:hypothetical protein